MKSSLGAGVAKANPGREIAGVIEVMAHPGRIPATARINMILLRDGQLVRVGTEPEIDPGLVEWTVTECGAEQEADRKAFEQMNWLVREWRVGLLETRLATVT